MSTKAFFIAGAQRSGTTLLASLLKKHPEVSVDNHTLAFRLVSCFSYFEMVLPYNLSFDHGAIQSWLIEQDYKGKLKAFLDYKNINQYNSAVELIDQAIMRRLHDQGKTIFVDKAPHIEHYVPGLKLLIPEAKFIHIVRDGRAVSKSMHKRASKNLYLAGQQWVDGTIKGLSNQRILGDGQYLIIKYEDLLTSPEETLKSICAFMEISFDPALLKEEARENEDSYYVKSSLNQEKINDFAKVLTSNQLRKLEGLQAPLLEHFDYPLHFPKRAGHHKQLTVFKRIIYNQTDNFKKLFVAKNTGMVDGKNVEIRTPLKMRIKAFLYALADDFLPQKVFKRLSRKRWVKNVYMSEDV